MKNHPPRRRLAALPVAVSAVLAVTCVSSLSHAQTAGVPSLADTVVTAARVPQDATLLPLGVQVITGQDIRAAGMATAREAIRWLGGVVSRSDTATGREPVLDLRGFGETAASNVVILVDGVRQNEGDMNGTVLAWIPVDGIERIEIVRGSGTVLHGEGATAGVINIITSKGLAEPGGSASLALGSNAMRDARASINTQAGSWRFQVHANAFDTDNHRASFDRQERNALARAAWADGASLWSVQLGGQSSQGHQPGGLTPADFATRPRFAYNTNDTVKSDLGNLLVSGELPVGDWRMGLDLNHRNTKASSDLQSNAAVYTYKADSQTKSNRVGVRAWREFTQSEALHRFLVGFDTERWHQSNLTDYYDATYAAHYLGDDKIQQNSRAVYGRHEVDFKSPGLKVFGGVRRTWSLREAQGSSGGGALDVSNFSWELGAVQRAGARGEVFAKAGTSFRLPNANEYTCFDPNQCVIGGTNLLRPQTSRDIEIGYRRSTDAGRWSVRFYRHDLTDEIGYFRHPLQTNASNQNLDPTRRQGVELDGAARLSSSLEAGLQYAFRQAEFRSGLYSGKDIPLVPKQSLTARVNYRMSATQQWLLTSQWLSAQRIGDDFGNASADRVPGYGILNLRYSQQVDAWTFSAAVNNLADKAHYNYRTRVNPADKSVYPEAGRTLLVSAQRRF